MRVIFIIHLIIMSFGVFSQTTGYVLQKADGTIEIPDSSITTAKISGLLSLLGTKQNLLGFTPKSVTDSGRATSNYVTGGSLKKLNDSTIAAMATLYGNDYRSANFTAGTNYLAPNGSAAALTNNNGGWNVLRVSGSNATTTGQSLTPITGLVTPTLTNGTLYEVEAVLYVSTSAVTTGTQYAFTANGTGGAAQVFINVSGTTTTNAATTVTQSASGTAAGTFLTTSGSSGIIVMKGFILTRGSGTATIELDHLKVTSGTSTVLIGSKFQYRLAQ